MKIRLTIARAGAGFSQAAGDEVEVPAEEGKRLIAAHKAVPVRKAKTERAVSQPPREQAVK